VLKFSVTSHILLLLSTSSHMSRLDMLFSW